MPDPNDPKADPPGAPSPPAAAKPTRPGTDYYDYGDLNPWAKPRIRRQFDQNNTKYFRLAQDSALKNIQANVFAEQENFKAIVLYSWAATNTNSGPWTLVPAGSAKQVVHVKARIPELHALPVPRALPTANNPADEDADWEAINLYPTYVAKDDLVNAYGNPQPGQIIRVTYENLILQEGPIFLGPVEGGFKTVITNTGQPPGGGRGGVQPIPVADPLPPGQLPNTLIQGPFMIIGDSQAEGSFGNAIQKRLREYGLPPVAGWTKQQTTRSGAKIEHHLPKNSFTGHSSAYHLDTKFMKGKDPIKFYKLKPKNVIVILGANSVSYEHGNNTPSQKNILGATALVNLIKRHAGPGVNIVWLTPSKDWRCSSEPNTAKLSLSCGSANCKKRVTANQLKKLGGTAGCVDFTSLNKARRMVGTAVQQAATGQVKAIVHAQDVFPQQTNAHTSDGVHMNAAGALALTNLIFPPVQRRNTV